MSSAAFSVLLAIGLCAKISSRFEGGTLGALLGILFLGGFAAGATLFAFGGGWKLRRRRAVRDAVRSRMPRPQAPVSFTIDAIVALDDRCRITAFNAAAERLFGHREKEMLGRPFSALLLESLGEARDRQGEDSLRLLECIRTGGAPVEATGVRADGQEFPMEIAVSGAAADAGGAFSVLLRDITDRRRIQVLQEACRTAQAANRAKDEFLAMLSHELRTPLAPVLMASRWMEEDKNFPPEVRELAGMVHRNVEVQAQLIDDLLDQTRIARGKLALHLAPINASEKVRHVVEMCAGEIALKELCVVVEQAALRPVVQADSTRMQQVLWNLLKNAVKFTPMHGSIMIRLSNPRPDLLRIEVSDTGVGITPETLPHIFDPFEQGGDDVTRRFGGLGLGLAISRKLAEMHGGALTARSAGRNQGATFILDLPTAQELPAPVTESGGGRAAAAGNGARILLVEDHADTARIVCRLMGMWGYEVRLAGSVREALDLAAAWPFDLLISDIGLPDGTGLDLMERLRVTGPVTSIAMSGYGMEEDLRRSREAGFLEHLVKPLNPKDLREAIERVLAASRSVRQGGLADAMAQREICLPA